MAPLRKILVIGGGPAGSVTATLLAREGLDVHLLEREHFPRYHIGESLTPSTRTVLDLLGLSGRLDAGGFQIKRGGVFRWGSDEWVVDWSKLFGPQVCSWQVDRAAFDQLLLENAEASGVTVDQGVAARNVVFDSGRPVSVTCTRDRGEPFVIDDFDFLVDASGRSGLLSTRHLGNRRPHPLFRNVAIWGYWANAGQLPLTPEGGINVISSPDGWYWIIPLADGRTSVGLVSPKDVFARHRSRHSSPEELYHALIGRSAAVGDLLREAEFRPAVRVETDYSYTADAFSGPGHMLVGDAACFLDPLLSTGVHLAMYSGLTAAASIAANARGEVTGQEALGFFEYTYRRAYTRLLALVSSMYDDYDTKEDFFWTAERLVHGDHGAGRSGAAPFGEIIAGLSDLREATVSSTRVLTERLTDEAFRVQRRAMAGGTGRPDLAPLRESPLDDNEWRGWQLVTEPRLGLARSEGDGK
ncbi:NAD(P)/FAD-dependent oxidoreductase [Actinomadura sp. DC4]|uniref:NAD(P)/FAD-dependent oxidoreductase n=1 Tax=Actinomadura sp. DC4 TaxID=3055069 RepID=UPI0025AF762F|nr:NAD(P)/FAD-dependent oxidoreductase [Actinomadura sp. DC4]MDN3358991.1 NAD(P)/FAD-dependent oxidoreductase [Actinomadura sp. DC4]